MGTSGFLPSFTLKQLFAAVTVLAVACWISLLLITATKPQWGRVYNQVTYLTLSPDGKQLAIVLFNARDAQVPGKFYVSDVTLKVVTLDTATLTKYSVVQEEFRKGNQGPFGFGRIPRAVAFTADSKQLRVGGWHGENTRTWDTASKNWSASDGVGNVRETRVVLSPDGKLSAKRQQSNLVVTNVPFVGSLFSIAEGWPHRFSPDGKYIVITVRNAVQVWDVQAKKLVRTFHENKDILDHLTCVELSPDGDTVAVRCHEGLRLYSIASGSEQVILPEYFEINRRPGGWGVKSRSGDGTLSAKFSPDGKLLVAWGEYGVKFFDMANGCKLRKTVADRSITNLVFSPDGQTYITGDGKGKVAIWDVKTDKELRSTYLLKDGPMPTASKR